MEIENIDNIRELAKTELEEYFIKLKKDYPITDFMILRVVKAMYKIHKFWIDVIPNLYINTTFLSVSPIKELLNHNFKYIKVYGLDIEAGEIIINFINKSDENGN